MGLVDWLRDHSVRAAPAKLTRRDFFARVTGRNPATDVDATPGYVLTHRFLVDSFEHHDGPAIATKLSPDLELQLRPDPPHLKDPRVRVYWGEHLLGYVPPGDAADLRVLLAGGERFRCRVLGASGSGSFTSSVEVAVYRPPGSVSSGR